MRYKIPIEIIELESGNYHPIVCCEFADNEKGFWVIDTGASKSVFDKNLDQFVHSVREETEDLHSASIGADPLQTSLALLKPFYMKNLTVEQLKVALLDLSHINELYSKVTDLKICGLLGSDFLLKYAAVVDYRKKRLVVRI